MAYVLIPDGFALKKVTKAQQDAVDEYFGRERRGSYLNTLIDNPTTATLAASVLTGGLLAGKASIIFSEGGPFTKEEIVEKLNPAAIADAAIKEQGPTGTFESAFDLVQEALRKKKEEE